MKKIIIIVSLLVILGIGFFFINNNNKQTNSKQKIKLAEVAHSIFYAPQYVADALGYFDEQNIDLDIILTPGADKVTAAVLSGDVDIGFCGSEATIYIYNQGEEKYLVNFAALTKKDGSFLVSREKIDNFSLDNVKNKYIIGGRKGGMPEMTLEWALKSNGIKLNETTIDTSVAFSAMESAFISGIGDYVTLFEPNALQVEKQGLGYVVASIGEYGGEVPYTTYNAKKSYIEQNRETINKFSEAIQKGLDYVHSNSSEEIANKILSYFPDISLSELTKIIERYKSIDAWFTTTEINEDSFNHVQEIMKEAGELSSNAPYDKLVLKNKK